MRITCEKGQVKRMTEKYKYRKYFFVRKMICVFMLVSLACISSVLTTKQAKAATTTLKSVFVQKGKAYDLKKLVAQVVTSSEKLDDIKKIKWKSGNKNIAIRNGKVKGDKVGTYYTIKGKINKETYILPVHVAAATWEKVPDDIVRIDISLQTTTKSITDVTQIQELCKRLNQSKYSFNYKRSNNPLTGCNMSVQLFRADGTRVRYLSIDGRGIKERLSPVPLRETSNKWARTAYYSYGVDNKVEEYVKNLYETV